MQSEEKMKTFVESKLKENTGNNALNLSAVVPFADKGGGPTGASMNAYLKNIQQWQERLTNYLHNMSADLEPDQWEELETSLGQFHEDVLLRYGDDGGFHMSSEEFAKKATDAVKYLKNGKLKINKAYEELYDDDPESEAKRVLSGIVDDVILLVDGGRPFQRIDIDWVDPTTDEDFNRQMYEFSSAEQILPDAEAIPWLVPASHQESKVLPRDLLKRLTTPLKCGDVDDHEDWEYSVTNPAELEEQYASFEPTFERLRVNLKAVLTEEIQNHSSNVDTTASINPAEVEEAARKLEAGEVNIDFKSLFILPYDVNLCKLVGVRDDSVGDLVAYKEVVKPPSERIADKNLRSDPKAWVDPDRPAGPHIRTYGWEPFADLGDDVAPEESEVVKKKENPDAFRADSILSSGDKARIDKRIQSLKKSVADRIAMKNYSDGLSSVNPDVKNYLDRKGQRFGIIPESFSTPEELLNSLDMPKLRENGSKVISMENEIIPIDPDWVGLDGSGEPHESLVEERYWKQLESFKKPPAAPLVDWKSILSQDLEGSEDPEDEELRKYLEEVTESHHKKEIEKPQEPVNQKVGKDTPARKRQLDEQFVKQWVDRFGSDEGIQGLDPKSFKIPEHLVSSEEYEEKYLTHPYTSSYVFHPNFVRFRRMTKNHPTYAEYAFEKLEPASTVNCDDNLKEFESVLAQLDEQGPLEKVEDVQQLNEKNFRIDPDEAKKWDSEFSSHMTEGLNLLESFAERMRKEFVKPETPCKEEESDDLLFARLDKYPKPDSLLEFHLEPFTLENFGSLPVLGQTNDVKVEEKLTEKLESSDTSSGSDDSDSEDEDVQSQLVNRTVEWRPIKKFSGYQGANVLQLLSDASQLLESSVPKHFHPPPRVMEWIQGKYQPSTNRLKKWRKLYSSLFPNTDSPLHTPYLFLTEDEKLAKLQKQTKEPDSDDPWALTKEEKSALKASKKAGQKSAEASETTEEPSQDGKDAERLTNLEELSGIRRVLQLRDEQWAEELDTQEAPDMSTLGTPAMEFPFELDKFQKQAIMALEKGYNVFVSAHTSAGKTAVAEYAIAMSRKRRSRAIYTSPIKALSNQKYNDFKKCFDSVGLITGDVQLNESADCLIMTTEILRSMLYNSSEGVRDLEFVVLDEVHYLNDRERGHVWEEVLILLPDNVQIVMLSATVPNTMEFASWVGRNKKRKVMVCKTLKRPVPLKHYFYADVSKIKNMDPSLGKFLLKDGDNPINTTQWEEIRHLIKEIDRIEKEERKKIRQKLDEKRAQNNYGRGGNAKVTLQELESESSSGSGLNKQEMMTYYHKKERKHWVSFINYLKDIEWMPTIVFAFSRKKCDELADLLNTTELSPLTTEPERRCIKAFIKSQVNKLDDEDKNLPQIQTLSKHLQNGIGVHHSGILPVLKEIVEFLFQQGKVKLLIATETFAMGVNMPARTVVFYSIKKFDGSEQRFLHPAEYIQMAGRAGRRGEDTVGNVIIKCQSRDAVSLTIGDIESMMTGAPCTLTSQFRISYRMLLNTLTTGSKITAVNMMAQSYHENHGQQELLKRKVALRQVTREEDELKQDIYSSLSSDVIDVYSRMYDAANIYLNMWCNLRDSEAQTSKFAKEVAVGKFIKFHCGIVVDKIGLIVSVTAKPIGYRVLALRDYDGHAVLEPPPDGNASERWYQFLSVLRPPSTKKQLNGELDMRLLIYDIKPKDVIEIYKDSVPLTEEKANTLVKSAQLANIGGRTKSDGELENICFKLHCASSMKQIDEGTFAKDNPEDWEFYQLLKFTEMELKKSIECTNESGDRTRFIETFFKIFKWKEILKKKENLDQIVLEKTMTGLYPEYSSKMEILMHMKYIIDDRVQMKGYMAARISKYELVLTEMLVRNVLKDLSPEEVVGLMAFIVYQTRGAPSQLEEEDKENPAPTPKLQQAIKDTIKIIEELTFEEKSRDIFSEELINLVNAFGLTHIMYSWAKQESFCKVISMAFDFQEGMLVRWIQQLVEALKEIESAARVMGNNDLPKKIQDAIKTIKRGIVFSPSLYTTL